MLQQQQQQRHTERRTATHRASHRHHRSSHHLTERRTTARHTSPRRRGRAGRNESSGRPSRSRGVSCRRITIYGLGDADACSALIGRLFAQARGASHATRDPPPSRFSRLSSSIQVDDCYAVERCGRLSRPFLGRFYGAGNYYYTALQLGLARPAGIFLVTPSEFARRGAAACGRRPLPPPQPRR